MSWQAYSLVFQRTRAKGSNLLMLLAIADYAHDNGHGAFASARTLTWKSRLTGRGGELVLIKLVADGEVWPVWQPAEHRLYLDIRCITDWPAYRKEGPLPTHSEKFSRNQSEKFSRKLVAIAERNANARAAKANATAATANGGAIPLCTGSEGDPSERSAGAAPLFLPAQPVENLWTPPAIPVHPDRSPDENIRVITKIVHEVLDNFALADDVTEGDVVEAVKRHCAVLDIAYDSAVVWSALESAMVQRQRIGKPSLR